MIVTYTLWKSDIQNIFIRGWSSVTMNYCINAAWCTGSPGCSDSCFHSVCIFGSCVSHLHFDNNNTDTLGFRSDELAGQWGTAILWPANHLLVVCVLRAGAKSCWKRKSPSLSIKFVSRLKHKVLQISRWVALLTVDLITQWINWHQHEEMTWHCRNFRILCLSTLPLVFRTLNFTFMWKEKHWAAVQFFLMSSPVQEWLDIRNAKVVAAFLETYRHQPQSTLCKVAQVLELIFLTIPSRLQQFH